MGKDEFRRDRLPYPGVGVAMDSHLQDLLNSLQSLADRLALEGRYVDAMIAGGGVLGLRAQRTEIASLRLSQPAPPSEVPPEGPPDKTP